MTDIKSLFPQELAMLLTAEGENAYRASQIFEWLHQKGAGSFDVMTDLPLPLRNKLAERFFIPSVTPVRKLVSSRDGTVKFLFEMHDGEKIESVVMRYAHGNTVCISTQAGCRMGCSFCASTVNGLKRNLLPSEMIGQVQAAQEHTGLKISNIVLMGIGEPLDNYDNVIKFLRLVNHKKGMNIGLRHISLSTCGLVPKIRLLAEKKLQLTLSVSLHAPSDEIRNTIMPVNRAYPVEVLLEACRDYYEATGRRISFEYAMIDGVNDSPDCARLLLRRLKGLPAHVNLIPLNEVAESPLHPSSRQAVQQFQRILEEGGLTATVRRTLGGDIDASCGQLRRKFEGETNLPRR